MVENTHQTRQEEPAAFGGQDFCPRQSLFERVGLEEAANPLRYTSQIGAGAAKVDLSSYSLKIMKSLIDMSLKGEPQGYPDAFNDAWREQSTNCTVSRMLQRIVVDNWSRDKAVAEMLDVLNKVYAKYA